MSSVASFPEDDNKEEKKEKEEDESPPNYGEVVKDDTQDAAL